MVEETEAVNSTANGSTTPTGNRLRDRFGELQKRRTVDIDAGAIEAVRPLAIDPSQGLDDPGQPIILRVGGCTLRFRWGQPHLLGTCAYWIDQTRQRRVPSSYHIGQSLSEEVVACLLGGFGVPAEIGLGAFRTLRAEGLVSLSPPPTPHEVEAALRRPIRAVGGHRSVRYRFPRQRAQRICAALELLSEEQAPTSPLALRSWLLRIPGVGLKTASWVVRNHLGADEVAIIDIHVRRAGLAAGFFDPSWTPVRHYDLFERSFLAVSRLGGVSPAALDACIWGQLHSLGSANHAILGGSGTTG